MSEKVFVKVFLRKSHYVMLEKIAKSLDLTVEDLVYQELDNAFTSAEVWLQRAAITSSNV
jgi:hypothetical protein